jgi:hypothetical protein
MKRLLALYGVYAAGSRIARVFHRAEAPHCREFRAARPADEILITGAAHYCQFDEVDGSIGFTAEACGCR